MHEMRRAVGTRASDAAALALAASLALLPVGVARAADPTTAAELARLEQALAPVHGLLDHTERLAASLRAQVEALRDAARDARTRDEEREAAERAGQLMLDLEQLEARRGQIQALLQEAEGRVRELRVRQ